MEVNMKLDYECLRSVALEIEDNVSPISSITNQEINDQQLFSEFPTEQVYLCIQYLIDNKCIKGSIENYLTGLPFICIHNMTEQGYNFCNAVRDNSIWGKIKSALFKTSTPSITDIIDTATGIIGIIKQKP